MQEDSDGVTVNTVDLVKKMQQTEENLQDLMKEFSGEKHDDKVELNVSIIVAEEQPRNRSLLASPTSAGSHSKGRRVSKSAAYGGLWPI